MTVDGWLQASYWRVRERGRLRPYVDSQSTNSYLRRQRLRTIHVLRVEPLRTGRGVHAALRSVEHHRPQSINQRIHSLMETDFAHDVVIRRNAPHSIQIGCCVPRAVPPSGHILYGSLERRNIQQHRMPNLNLLPQFVSEIARSFKSDGPDSTTTLHSDKKYR